MELKPQDLLVLLKVAAHPPQRWTYAALGEALSLSASETHASVKRSVACGLAVAPHRGEWSPVRPNLLEFIEHGVRYIWPATPGPIKRGVPTAFGAEPLGQPTDRGAGRGAGLASCLRYRKGSVPVAAVPERPAGRAC